VHKNHAAGERRYRRRHLRVPAQGADVIHNLCTGVDRGACNLGFVSIHGKDRVRTLTQHVFNHWHDAAEFFPGGNARFSDLCSRPGRFAANVQHVRALIQHFKGVGHGVFAGKKFSTVRK
jgi:hypothetical protein